MLWVVAVDCNRCSQATHAESSSHIFFGCDKLMCSETMRVWSQSRKCVTTLVFCPGCYINPTVDAVGVDKLHTREVHPGSLGCSKLMCSKTVRACFQSTQYLADGPCLGPKADYSSVLSFLFFSKLRRGKISSSNVFFKN